jgi:hypothetical protein
MAVRLSALRAGRTLPPSLFIFKDCWYSFLLGVDPRAIVRPEELNSTIVISCEWNGQRILSAYFVILMFAFGTEVYRVIWVQRSLMLLRPSSTKRAVSCLSGGWMDGSLPTSWLHAADVDVCLAVLVSLQSCGRKKPQRTNFTQHRTSVKTSTLNNDVRGLPSTAGVTKLRTGKI